MLTAEMEQSVVSRCLQLLVFILQIKEQITRAGKRLGAEPGKTSGMVPRRQICTEAVTEKNKVNS